MSNCERRALAPEFKLTFQKAVTALTVKEAFPGLESRVVRLEYVIPTFSLCRHQEVLMRLSSRCFFSKSAGYS